MKYLKDKNTRRRGVAMEMAIMVLLVLTLLSTITVSTATILINKQSSAQKEFTDKIERYKYDSIGEKFLKMLSSNDYKGENFPNLKTNLALSNEVVSQGLLIDVTVTPISTDNPAEGEPESQSDGDNSIKNIYKLEVYVDLNSDEKVLEKFVLLTVEVLEEASTIPVDTETEVTPGVGNDEGEGSNPTDDNTGDNTSQVTEEPADDPNEGTGEGDQTNSETVTYIYTIISWEYQ